MSELPSQPTPTLSYGLPEGGRPGIVTAMGVVSIVLSVIGLLTALYSLTQVVGMQFVRMSMRNTTVTSVTTTTAPSGTGTTTVVTSSASPTPWTFSFSDLDIPGLLLGGIDVLARFALTGLLLTAAIQALRDAPNAAGLHRIWAWARMAVSFVGAAAYCRMLGTMLSTVPTAAGVGSRSMMGAMYAVAIAYSIIPVCIYPIAVLIILRTKRVRYYYRLLGA